MCPCGLAGQKGKQKTNETTTQLVGNTNQLRPLTPDGKTRVPHQKQEIHTFILDKTYRSGGKKMIITANNIEALEALDLHDTELLEIAIDYAAHKANISLKNEHGNKYILLFERMQYCSITGFEPWGEGMYVSEINGTLNCANLIAKLCNDYVIHEDSFMTMILLNSGDKIEILSGELNYALAD